MKKLKCMLKRRTVVDGDNRRLAAFTNAGREAMLVGAFTNQEGFNRHNNPVQEHSRPIHRNR
ncbi:Uncharacterised protein [Brucella melitensis]|nr:Uncharacterised protein [Brucella melitensis]